MSKLTPEKIAALGTAIALELAKDKTRDEIKEIKALIAQIQSTLNTILL